MVVERPFAAFDIDGTIIRWQLYHALADELARMGQLDAIQFQAVRKARMAWKKRSPSASFEAYETTLINLIDVAIINIQVEDLQTACRTVLTEYKDQVYVYTRNLINELKAKNYLLFAISASQSQIVEMIADYYGFDDCGGSVYEVKNGCFTGGKQLLTGENKPKYLEQLVSKHDATWQGSIAVGDSAGDIPMLERVQQPIAFNPARQLFEHAQAKGWTVVVERKDMVYKLEAGDGHYQLKK